METMMVLHPAIEIIGNRHRIEGASRSENSLMTIADNGGGIGFVFGDPVEDWRAIDFRHHLITLTVGGGAPADNFLGEMRCLPVRRLPSLSIIWRSVATKCRLGISSPRARPRCHNPFQPVIMCVPILVRLASLKLLSDRAA